MNESDIQNVFTFPIYPRDSMIPAYKGLVIIDNRQMSGTHCTCYYKDNNKNYFASFGRHPDKFTLNQLLKTRTFNVYKYQVIKNRFSGKYCIYFSYLTKRLDFHNAVLENYFVLRNP